MKYWDRMTKKELIEELESSLRLRSAATEETKKQQEYIEELKARCLTLKAMYEMEAKKRAAYASAFHGVSEALSIREHETSFSVLHTGPMDNLAKKLNRAITICPNCGAVKMEPASKKSGLRLCPGCVEKVDWPWPKDYEENGYTLAE